MNIKITGLEFIGLAIFGGFAFELSSKNVSVAIGYAIWFLLATIWIGYCNSKGKTK